VNNGSVVVARAFSTIFRIKNYVLHSPEDGPLRPKHVVIRRDNNINKRLSVAIAGIYLKDFYADILICKNAYNLFFFCPLYFIIAFLADESSCKSPY
jgi:hypothetical protein